MKALLDLFSASWQSFWSKLIAARREWKAPRGCQFRGYLVGLTPRERLAERTVVPGRSLRKRAVMIRSILEVSGDEALGQDFARKTRQPSRPVNAIPVWRRQWTDADRKPWVRAIPYAQV